MGLPQDLKNYRAKHDPFQLIEEGIAGLSFFILMIFAALVWGFK